MKYLVFAFLALYGVYYYVSRHYEFHDTLVYAHAHKDKSWAGTVDYYVGLVYYQRGEFAKAQEAFTQLENDLPEGGVPPAKALLMLGDSAENLQDWDTARTAFSTYVEKYPTGGDLTLARSRVEMINYKHGPGH